MTNRTSIKEDLAVTTSSDISYDGMPLDECYEVDTRFESNERSMYFSESVKDSVPTLFVGKYLVSSLSGITEGMMNRTIPTQQRVLSSMYYIALSHRGCLIQLVERDHHESFSSRPRAHIV